MWIVLITVCLAMEACMAVYGQNESVESKGQKQHVQKERQITPDSGPSKSAGNVAEAKEASQGAVVGQKPSEPYFRMFFSPGNLPNVVLALVGIGGIIVAIRTLNLLKRQTDAIRRQAATMEQQVSDARTTSAQQAKDVQASIAEAVKSAQAMEGIAVSMASNVESVRQSVGISREIADTQKLAIELQSRAYLSVSFNAAKFQDANHLFEVQAVIRNHGNTPAYDVAFRAVSQIVPLPLPEDFTFPLPPSTAGASASLMAPGTTKLINRIVPAKVPDDQVDGIKRGVPPWGLAMWGIVNYRDAFREARQVRFAFHITWIPWVAGKDKDKDGNPLPEQTMSFDTAHHNDAD